MELVLNLPPMDWYRNTTNNDLSYWGLDYPPLSAYMSWLLGKLVAFVEPAALRLHTSRGYQSALSRVMMRSTVILGDLFVFLPALLLVLHRLYGRSDSCAHGISSNNLESQIVVCAFCISLPALILVDHAHFQYNNISLGFFCLALAFFISDREGLGAVFFCCSLYFKQMGLYYGLAVFTFLASRTVRKLFRGDIVDTTVHTAKILAAIALTTTTVFWPWIQRKEDIEQVLFRLFPLSRGLYEDKVANVWCSISILIKLNKIMEQDLLFKFCAVVTVLASLPFCLALALRPSHERLLLAIAGCALSAYLFSYQVHEKQILIPLMPLSLLYGIHPMLSTWTSWVSMISIFPLLHREGLSLAYAAIFMAHLAVILATWSSVNENCSRKPWDLKMFFGSFVIGMAVHLMLIFGKPPETAPHVFVLLNTIYACGHLCLIYMYTLMLVWL